MVEVGIDSTFFFLTEAVTYGFSAPHSLLTGEASEMNLGVPSSVEKASEVADEPSRHFRYDRFRLEMWMVVELEFELVVVEHQLNAATSMSHG